MPAALVGTIGTVVTGGSNASVTPAFGTGESRTANNLLVLWVAGSGSTTLPAAPAGWSTAFQEAGASNCSASVFYKIAAGADAAPTVAAVAGTLLSAQLGEFSGLAPSAPLDKTGVESGGLTSPQSATAGGADVRAGELVAYCAAERYTSAATKTNSVALNNGATANDTNNNASALVNHYNFGYGITTGASAADSATLTFTVTTIADTAIVVASFLLPPISLITDSRRVSRNTLLRR